MYWILDVLFFLLIIIGILFGVRRGFIAGVCKLAGTILSVAVGVLFCNALSGQLEVWFGMTSALTGAIGHETIAGWISIAISFLILLIVTKLGAWLLGVFGTFLAEKIKLFSLINKLCGGLLGLFKSLVLIFLLLTACYWLTQWLNLTALESFINQSTVVGVIFRWEWFIELAQFHFLIPKG